MSKFNRIFELRVQEDGVGDQPGPLAIIRTPMTVEFAIERSNMADQNSANFKVYNLSPETRSKIFHDVYVRYMREKPIGPGNYPRIVEFYAGYENEGQDLTLCFVGLLYYAHSTRRGSDFITELECQDPGINNYLTISAKSLEKTQDKKDIIRSLYEDMVGRDAAAHGYISPTFTGTSSRGQVMYGNTMRLLRELTGNNFFFDLGRPISLPLGEVLSGTDIYELNSESGVINVPIKTGVQVIVKMLFSPELKIGQAVNLNLSEKEYNGMYTINSIRHSGIISGTHDAQTLTEISLINKAITAAVKA